METFSGLRRAAETLVLLSTATLFFRRELFYLFKPFELGILAAAGCVAIHALKTQSNPLRTLPRARLWLTLFASMFFWGAIGTANGYRIYGIADPVKTAGGFFYLGIAMTAFLFMLGYDRKTRFRAAVRRSFFVPVIFTPFVFMPSLAERLSLVSERIHFYGLHKSPTTFAFLASIACIAMAGGCFEADRRNARVFLWLGAVGTLSLSLWTGSRAAWLAIGLGFAWIALCKAITAGKGRDMAWKLRHLTLLCAAGLLSLIAAFAILPHNAQIMSVDRIYPQISNNFPDYARLEGVSLKTALRSVTAGRPSLPYQSREFLWPQAFALFTEHPMGLGMEYFRSAKEIRQNGYATHSHNTLLQAGLTGGIGLLATYLLFVCAVIRKARMAPEDGERTTLSAMLLGGSVFLMIGEFLYIAPWIWVIAGLACARAGEAPAPDAWPA